jgi:hypothetical protein
VLVPVGLFAGFKLTGVISGPATIAETVHLQPVVWIREEPYLGDQIPGDPFFNTSYAGDDVALDVSHWLGYGAFDENSDNTQFWGGPTLWSFGIEAVNASVPKGFVTSVEVAYREAYPQSSAEFFEKQGAWFYGNLTLSEAVDRYSDPQVLGENKAYVKASAVGQPRAVYMGNLWLYYHLSSPYNYTHQIMIDVTVTYFNGTVYKQLVQPVELVFGPDHNNSFQTAEEIGFGVHQDYVDDSINGDPVDYFKIYLQEGTEVRMSVLVQGSDYQLYPANGSGLNPDVFLYDTNRNLEAYLVFQGSNLQLPENDTSQIVLNVNQTGWWYVKATTTYSWSLYALDVSLLSG